jgi:hypothetical protein
MSTNCEGDDLTLLNIQNETSQKHSELNLWTNKDLKWIMKQNMIYAIMFLLVLSGCQSLHIVPITNNLSIYMSEGDKWDLLALVDKSFDNEIERIEIGTMDGGASVAVVHFTPKQIDAHTFEFKKCLVWNEDWWGGWGRLLEVKIRQGKWYSDLHVHKIFKQTFTLKSHTILIPQVKNATYEEIHELLRKIEDREYLITELNLDDTQINIDFDTIIMIEKDDENGNISYKIWTSTEKHQGSYFVFTYRNGKLYLTSRGMLIS